jgi:peptidoglycan/LPS O-acetylase OafA/YrhL
LYSADNSHFAPLPVAYLTVFLGLTNPARIKLLDTGDYSYGIFLYGFPIEQSVVATGFFPRSGLVTLLVSVPIIVLFAAFSWHLCEKWMLKLRRYRSNIDVILGFTAPGAILRHFIIVPRLLWRK